MTRTPGRGTLVRANPDPENRVGQPAEGTPGPVEPLAGCGGETSGAGSPTEGNMNRAAQPIQMLASRRRIILAVIPTMVLPFFASLVYFVWLAGSITATIVYSLTKVFTVVWPILAAILLEGYAFKPRPVRWKRHWAALPLGAATGLLVGGAIIVAYRLTPVGDYARASADDVAGRVMKIGITGPGRYVMVSVLLAGLHSLVEEFFWRWYVFGRLHRTVPHSLAYLLANLGFAGHHYVVLSCYFSAIGTFAFGTSVGLGGVLWCWLYRRQRTLAGCWFSHALVDAVIFCIGYRLVFA